MVSTNIKPKIKNRKPSFHREYIGLFSYKRTSSRKNNIKLQDKNDDNRHLYGQSA